MTPTTQLPRSHRGEAGFTVGFWAMNASNFARASGDAESNADFGVEFAYVTDAVPLSDPGGAKRTSLTSKPSHKTTPMNTTDK